MPCRIFFVFAFTFLFGSGACAESYIEKVKKVDAAKMTIIIPVDGKDTTFKVIDKVDVRKQVKAGKRIRLQVLKNGLKGVKVGETATITTEKQAGAEVVTKIVLLLP